LLNQWDELLKKHPAVTNWLLILVTVVFFRGALTNGFVYDDGRQVLENPFVKNPHLWRNIFTGPVWSFLGAAAETNFYRPFHILSYWLVWRVAGANPAAFHLYQLTFYVLAVLLVYWLGQRLFQDHLAAFAGALLWTLHPLHVEPVCWIAAVPDVGCGLFYLLAFWLFLSAERGAGHPVLRHAFAVVSFAAALLFKEMALTFPLLLLAYWYFFRDEEPWFRKGLRWLPYLGATMAYAGLRVLVLGHFSHAGRLWKISPRVAGAALGLLGEHTRLFFWPAQLNDFHTFELGPSLRSPWPWLTLLAVATVWLFRKRRPMLTFLIIWWPLTLLPALDVRQLSSPLLAERFSFLPTVGLCLAVAYVATVWLPARLPRLSSAPVMIPALVFLLAVWAAVDLRAIPRWRNNDTLWNYSYEVEPNSALVHVHRAFDLQYRHYNLKGANEEFQIALRLNRASFKPLASIAYDCYIGLGQIAYTQGREQEGLAYFGKAVELTPSYSAAYDMLGSVYFPRGEYGQAAEYFRQAVRVNPMDMGARFFLGTCLLKLGKPLEAAAQFRAARQVDPGYIQAYEAEAHALEQAGDAAGAAQVRRLKAKD
jgi:tetratricopeptide (TPR) repeat protein